MPIKTVFKKTTGINTSIDPADIKYEEESGVSELAYGVNIDITNAGRPETTQTGYSRIFSGSYHSVWRDTGDAFCGKGTELYKINSDKSLLLVRSALSGDKIDYCQIGNETYYGNGVQHGMILNSIALPWPSTRNYLDTINVMIDVPPMNHLASADGRIYFSIGNMLCWTELLIYGTYAPKSNHIMFGSKIRMIKPVDGGLFLSTEKQTWFLSGHDPHKFVQSYRPVGSASHEWSVESQYRDGLEIGLQVPGQCAFWTCNDGACVGTPSGQVIVMNKDNVIYPKSNRGASLLYGDQLLHVMWEI